MHTEASGVPAARQVSLPAAQYMSSEQLLILLDLLMELRDLTLSRATLRTANKIIVDVGGADRLACECFVMDAVE